MTIIIYTQAINMEKEGMSDSQPNTPEMETLIDVHQNDTQSNGERWHCLGTRVPRAEIVYFCQMIVVYIVIITSIINLSMENGSKDLWISLLSSSIGYALPSPNLKKQ